MWIEVNQAAQTRILLAGTPVYTHLIYRGLKLQEHLRHAHMIHFITGGGPEVRSKCARRFLSI